MAKSLKLYLSIACGFFISFCLHGQTKVAYLDTAYKYYPQTSVQFRQYLKSAIKVYPNEAELWRGVATSYFMVGEYAPAIHHINKAVELDPATWLSYRAFMKCIFLKDYANAIEDFRKALNLNDKRYEMDHSYYFYMGVSYLKLNQLDSADHYLDLSVNLKISKGKNWVHYIDWFYWGLIKHKQNDNVHALEYYDNALTQFSNFPDAMYYKALILLKEGKKEEARELLIKAEDSLQQDYRLNETNEMYVNYPFQISIHEVQSLLKEYP